MLRCLAAATVIWNAALAFAAPIPTTNSGSVADRKDFIPNRKHGQLPGKLVGVLVPDAQPLLSTEGRSGPADQLCFSADGNSYRWVYVQVEQNPGVGNLMLPVGDGKQRKRFDRLSLATPATVKQFGLDGGFALVEIEVNGGLGSPADDSFAATRITRLDSAKDYPLHLPDVMKSVRAKYDEHQKDSAKRIDEGLTEAAQKAIGSQKPTGPREREELQFVIWDNATGKLRVHFRTRITDGAYQYAGGVNIELGPAATPAAKPGTLPPQRLPNGLRYGKQFGVEFGMAYVISKDGRIERSLPLPQVAIAKDLPRPPIFDRIDAPPKKK
jgi:hypothetical protein